jgi:hypothetical protein
MKRLKPLIAALLCVALVMPVTAQSPAQQPPQSSPAQAPSAETKTFSQAELDQVVAPIALYPDALLAQVLIASTYPIEVVYADRRQSWPQGHGPPGRAAESILGSGG